jgi:hypothetical protein
MTSGEGCWTAEQCWVLIGGRSDGRWSVRMCRPTEGSRTWVEADWAWTLQREETQGDVAGFLHSHPPGSGAEPSARDLRTMRAWCLALGKPLLCLIEHDGSLQGSVHADEQDPGRPLGRILRVTAERLEITETDVAQPEAWA